MLCHMLKNGMFFLHYVWDLVASLCVHNGVGYQGPYIHSHLSWCRLPLCPPDAVTRTMESTTLLQGER